MSTLFSTKAKETAKKYGYWDEHPDCPIAEWQQEVNNGETRAGYWEWATAIQSDGARI